MRNDTGQTGGQREAELRDHASRASALLANRTAGRKGPAGLGRHTTAPDAPAEHAEDAAHALASDNQARGRTRRTGSARKFEQPETERTPQGGQNGKLSPPARRSGPRQEQATPQPRGRTIGEYVRENMGYIVSVAFVVVVVVAGIFAARAFLPFQPASTTDSPATTTADSYVSPFDWTCLDRTDGRYRYIVNGEVKSRLGIDVSENQGWVDWQAVANDGIEFAMIRLGYRGATKGELYVDNQFWANLDGARNAGLDCGVYFFSQADTVEDAAEEAEFVLAQLSGVELQYPVAFDSEVVNLRGETSPTAHLSQDEMTAIAETFIARIEKAGYRTLLYGNLADLTRYHNDLLYREPVWWAEYNAPVPNAHLDLALWQYSNAGQINGIATAVDLNIDLTGAL